MNPELLPRHIVVDDDVVRLYRAFRPFTVDEVLYWPPHHYNGTNVRTMIEIIDDFRDYADDFDPPAEMFHSDPPTEAELDHYVRQGHLPPT